MDFKKAGTNTFFFSKEKRKVIQDGCLSEHRNRCRPGTEKEKSDDRSEDRRGFETIAQGMQNSSAWYVFTPKHDRNGTLFLLGVAGLG